MSHVRIPDFSQPAPVRRPVALPASRTLPPVDLRHRHAAAALHDEPTPGGIEPWQAVAPVRPDTAHVRSLRFLDAAGELLCACLIIGCGGYLVGLVTLL